MKNINEIVFTCPLCGNSETEKIKEFQSTDILTHLGINQCSNKYILIKNNVEKLWMQDRAYFLICKKCSFQFAYPFVAGDHEFYNTVYDGEVNYPEWKWDYEISFHKMSQLIDQNSDNIMLEIGAGNGSFVKRIAKSLLASKNIITTEFSDYGREKISNLGIVCLPVNLSELLNKGYENFFDFICMFQVLEHMDNIDDVFKTLFKLLKNNGHLFITVPNNMHRLYFNSLHFFEDVPPIHINRWNLENFRFVARKYEMEVIDYQIQNGSVGGNVKKFLDIKYRNVFKLNLPSRGINKLLQKFVKYTTYLFFSIRHINKIMPLFYKKNMGVSQWVHFKKV